MTTQTLNEAQTRRLRQLFRISDADRDGQVDVKDHLLAFGRLARLRRDGVVPSARETLATVAQRFEFLRAADADGDSRVTEDEYLAHCAREFAGREALSDEARQYVRAAFDAYDVDHDGVIGLADYVLVHIAYGLDPRVCCVVGRFNEFDRDGDGKLHLDEFMELTTRFFLSRDDVPFLLCVE